MPMQQLIYASRPFGYDTATLAGILSISRVRNAQNDITGALICRSDIYLQLLEGPVGKVEKTYERILTDDRHVEMRVLVRSQVEDRLFPEWAMRHDPAHSWMWTAKEVANGALDRASARDVRAVFLRLANQKAL
ncbi:MAG: BLUF domain-containing protein [Roseobacter sp.]